AAQSGAAPPGSELQDHQNYANRVRVCGRSAGYVAPSPPDRPAVSQLTRSDTGSIAGGTPAGSTTDDHDEMPSAAG
ncbi:MAG: hypothetical protein ACRDRH_26070, partial [Pseudonocardia sp.]